MEGKGPEGRAAVAQRQAMFDGAVGARAMHHLQSYGQPEPVYDNNAYTMTCFYCDGTLKMYTIHTTAPASPGGRPHYHMNHLRSFALTDRPDTFRGGAAAYRNARDWVKENHRRKAIEDGNQVGATAYSNKDSSTFET